MRPTRSATLLLPCLALAACAHGPAFRCEARGGAAWSEYRSKHFVVDSDAPAGKAAQLINLLETLQLLDMKALVGTEVELPGHLRVVALARDGDFRDLAGPYVGGYYRLGQFEEPTIVIPVSAISGAQATIAHELAHYLSRFLFPDQPHWLAEGLAQFVETLAEKPAGTRPPVTGSHMAHAAKFARHRVGEIPSSVQGWPRSVAPIPVLALLNWDGTEDRSLPGLYHASSWLLYHWLWNQRSAQFSDFQKRLSTGESPAAAWLAAFPEYDPAHPETFASLDATLDRYRRGMAFATYAVEGTADGNFVQRPFPSAEAHLLLLAVRGSWPDPPAARKALVESQMDEALREDPRNPLAATFSTEPQPRPAPEKFRAATAQAPEDFRAWLLLSAVVDGAEKEAALRKAVGLNPDSARAQNEFAWFLATSDRAREALPVANRALDLAPWDPKIVDTLAEVAARLSQCSQALQLEARAVSMRPADEGLRKRQADVQQRCPKS